MHKVEDIAKKRHIRLNNENVIDTPLLIPSFSSKILSDVNEAIRVMKEIIAESMLVSAYDIHHSTIETPIVFTDFLIIDSGGYECNRRFVPQEGEISHIEPKEWSSDLYNETLEKIEFNDRITKTAIVNFDHPDIRESFDNQINKAEDFFKKWDSKIKIFLAKPEKKGERFLNIENIIKFIRVSDISIFDIIGFTDKELGPSLLERMASVVKIRNALNEKEMNIPIHIFGSLDTVTTPLYFLSGADVFDGLSWMKFYFQDEFVHYLNSGSSLFEGITMTEKQIATKTWVHNIGQIDKLQNSMMSYLGDYDLSKAFDDVRSKTFEQYQNLLINKMSRGM